MVESKSEKESVLWLGAIGLLLATILIGGLFSHKEKSAKKVDRTETSEGFTYTERR